MNLAPRLTGRHVRLDPLTRDDTDALVAAATEPGAAYAFTSVPTDTQAAASYIGAVLAEQARGTTIAFAIVDLSRAQVVGATRFLNLAYWPNDPWPAAALAGDRRTPSAVEVGGTWLALSAQRTAINTEAKLLMLRHAFETWAVRRVTLKTDARNTQSRQAIERIGATFEGIRRADLPAVDGTIRDTAYYSILAAEWAPIARRLEEMLDRRGRQAVTEPNITSPRPVRGRFARDVPSGPTDKSRDRPCQ